MLLATSPARAQFASEWDTRKVLESIQTQAAKLRPLLEQVKPDTWADQASAASYKSLVGSALNEVQYLTGTVNQLKEQPERLTLALEAFFRMQSLEFTVLALNDGIRKYQNPAVADLLRATLAENADNREQLRQYVSDLAAAKEKEFEIVDKEAQRCRGTISRQPPPRPGPKKPQP